MGSLGGARETRIFAQPIFRIVLPSHKPMAKLCRANEQTALREMRHVVIIVHVPQRDDSKGVLPKNCANRREIRGLFRVAR